MNVFEPLQLPNVARIPNRLAKAAMEENMATVRFQLGKLSQGKATQPAVSPLRALVQQQIGDAARVRRYRRWIAERVAA